MRYASSVTDLVGNTPLVRLNAVTAGIRATVLAKVEGRNPACFVKCRLGAVRVWDAGRRGVLGPGKPIAEPTCGDSVDDGAGI